MTRPDLAMPADGSCPHGDDRSHGGLGRAWCDAGREGALRGAAVPVPELPPITGLEPGEPVYLPVPPGASGLLLTLRRDGVTVEWLEPAPAPVTATFRFEDEEHLRTFIAEHVARPCSDLTNGPLTLVP